MTTYDDPKNVPSEHKNASAICCIKRIYKPSKQLLIISYTFDLLVDAL